MTKKNRDLFEILGARNGSSVAGGLVKRVQELVSAPAQPAPRVRARSRSRGKQLPNGLVLAAVAFGCLVLGFAGGRFSAASTGPEEGLSARTDAAAFGTRPSRYAGPEAASAAAPTDAQLTENLSMFGFILLLSPVPESEGGDRAAFEDAKRLTLWFWDRGFSNVRARRMSAKGQPVWVVVDYVQTSDDTAEHAKLAAIEPPEDLAPSFGARIAKQALPFTFQS